MTADYCACDYEPPSVLHEDIRQARKDRPCSECRRTIRAGERYEHTWGIWEGDANSYDTCCHCLALREYTRAHVPCFCWCYTTMRDDAMETLSWADPEAPGLWFGGARHYVRARRLRQVELRARARHADTDRTP